MPACLSECRAERMLSVSAPELLSAPRQDLYRWQPANPARPLDLVKRIEAPKTVSYTHLTLPTKRIV